MKKITLLLYSLLLINSSLYSLTLETIEVKLSSYWGETDCNNGLSNLDTTVTNYEGASSDCPLYFGGNASDYSSYNTDLFNQKISTSCYQGGSLWSFQYNFVTKRECKGYDPTCTELEYIDRTSIPYTCKTKPVCTSSEYYDDINNVCLPIPSCPLGQYFDQGIQMCTTIPTCPYENEVFNTSTETCECSSGFTLVDSACVSDIDSDGIPDTMDADIDGDGIPNSEDGDIDGDGIANEQETTNTSTCLGQDYSTIVFYGIEYLFSTYNYYGKTNTIDLCSQKYVDPNIDSSALLLDLNPACEDEYCYIHNVVTDCYFNFLDFKPIDYIRYDILTNLNDIQCSDAVTGYPYIENYFVIPDLVSCPNTTFCFLKLADEAPDSNTTTADLNSTLEMLNELKTGNAKLTDLNTKLSGTNERLDTLNKHSLDILGANNEIKSTLDTMRLNDVDTSGKMISEQKLINDKLQISNDNLSGMSSTLQSLNTNVRANGFDLSNIASNTRNINDNLINMTGILSGGTKTINNPLDGNYSDGSSGFLGYETELKDNMALTYESDFFGLSSLGSSGLTTISFNFYGTSMTVFEPSMLDGIPIADIRNLFMFFFALAGFITVFRTI